MCGVCGIFDPHRVLASSQIEKDLAAMTTEFQYRGPDASGTHLELQGSVGMGHRRLSIIDLSGGQQPMASASGQTWITFNGEIYNYQEERKLLEREGVVFRTRSDTEVILALYERYGTAAWNRLCGQFAFGLWDGKRNELFLVRDRLGEKPLCYAEHDRVLYFASEAKALLRTSYLPRELDGSVLGIYFLLQHVPAPATLAKGIRKLPPGYFLRASSQGLNIERYWKPSTHPLTPGLADPVTHFRAAFEKSVQRCLVSDVPVGTYLSGGLDSTAVTWAASLQQHDPLHSFAIFNRENHEQHPDWIHAQQAAEALHTTHHNVFYELPQLMKQIPEFIERTDEPFEGPTALVSLYLAKATREHVKVVLTGNGGDELLGGYESYYRHVQKAQHTWQRLDQWIPKPLRHLAGILFAFHPQARKLGLDPDLRRITTNRGYHARWLKVLQPGPLEAIEPLLLEMTRMHRTDDHGDYFRRYLWDDLFLYHHHSVTTMPDATGMACSLEARNPFLDYQLVEFLLRLDPDLLIQQQTNKYLLVEAMKKHIPPSILYRKKEGFSGMTLDQITHWIRGEGRPLFRDMLLDSRLARDGYVAKEGLARLWALYEGTSDRRDFVYFQIPLWCAVMLELWYRRHFLNERGVAT